MIKTLLVYSICYLCLCVSSFGAFPVFQFSRPISALYTKITSYLGFYARYCMWCVVGGEGGYPVWLGGVYSLVRGVTWACSLTYQTDYRLRVPVRIPFPQGTGELSSADNP